ncbi:hypothetical protein NE237_028906 [Protea cynaroides]|uniref:Uncharacterized protein n=1 Tax=Protea cynaroides TaxID=273540 RepID=A0A9Q0GUS5_9MAGN|nr:hypothetical protein NE237_028906 [Protea cynaroides]
MFNEHVFNNEGKIVNVPPSLFLPLTLLVATSITLPDVKTVIPLQVRAVKHKLGSNTGLAIPATTIPAVRHNLHGKTGMEAADTKGEGETMGRENSMPEMAIRFSLFADFIFVVFNSSLEYFPKHKCTVSGIPVRLSLRLDASKVVTRSHFFPNATNDGIQRPRLSCCLGDLLVPMPLTL